MSDGGKHILVGDDSPEILALYRDIFEGEGYRVTMRADALTLLDSWHRLYGYVEKCDTQDRYHLQTISARISPVMIELRTSLTK